MDWTPEELQAIVDEHALVLFMKGTPDQAQCGFSNRAAQVMQALGEPFAAVNILTDPRAIPSVCTWSDFPTMPQVFVHGELIGGSDIALEMLNDGYEHRSTGHKQQSSIETDCKSVFRFKWICMMAEDFMADESRRFGSPDWRDDNLPFLMCTIFNSGKNLYFQSIYAPFSTGICTSC